MLWHLAVWTATKRCRPMRVWLSPNRPNRPNRHNRPFGHAWSDSLTFVGCIYRKLEKSSFLQGFQEQTSLRHFWRRRLRKRASTRGRSRPRFTTRSLMASCTFSNATFMGTPEHSRNLKWIYYLGPQIPIMFLLYSLGFLLGVPLFSPFPGVWGVLKVFSWSLVRYAEQVIAGSSELTPNCRYCRELTKMGLDLGLEIHYSLPWIQAWESWTIGFAFSKGCYMWHPFVCLVELAHGWHPKPGSLHPQSHLLSPIVFVGACHACIGLLFSRTTDLNTTLT